MRDMKLVRVCPILRHKKATRQSRLHYKTLPDAPLTWRDVWIGAAFTAGLFSLGKYAIGLYLGNSGVASSFGAAGSLIALLLWVYYSA